MTKHGARIPEPLCLIVQQPVFCAGPHTTGCTLGAQAQAVAIAIVEAVHFFFDYICYLTHRALEQLGLLKYRKANLPITIAGQHLSDSSFQILPDGGLFWEQIIHAPDGLDFHSVVRSLVNCLLALGN